MYIFPLPRCLLIKGYQKLRTNNYNNSIFLLRKSLIYQTHSIYCAVVPCTDTAGQERGGWCSTSILPSSPARQTQGFWHSLAGSAVFVCTHPGGGFQFKESQFPAVPRLLGWLAQDAQRDTSKLSKYCRKILERSGQNHQFECSGLIWIVQKCVFAKPRMVFAEHPSVYFAKWKAFIVAASILLNVSGPSPRPAEL